MHISKQKIALALAGFVSVSVLAIAPVYAQHGAGDTIVSSNSTIRLIGPPETEHVVTTTTVKTPDSASTLRQKAQDLLQTKRVNHPEKTLAQRQKVCEDRATGINKRFNTFDTMAAQHLEKINAAYTKLQAFQTKNKLTVSNYDALVATADAQKANAVAAVATLKSVSGVVDCTSTDPAASVATVKTAVRNAHDTLQAYRQSVRAILTALMSAKTTSTNSTENQ